MVEYIQNNLLHHMQDVLDEIIKTYNWEEMEITLHSPSYMRHDAKLLQLVSDYYIGLFDIEHFKISFRREIISQIYREIHSPWSHYELFICSIKDRYLIKKI
jgi:hypothetical protein